ncbi:hypothetical protein ACERZ8_21340 [Tateyamaria armeniaca]|uniref:Uncharacterized protein n=1 Tax=Tateyamaria armeniaca TaxID=2518930 RepID=A0ABW8UYR8_9RHOB
MLLTQFINCTFGATGLAMAQMGAAGQSLRVKIVTLGISICAVTVGTLAFGVIGTAIGFLMANFVQNAWLAWIVRRKFGVDPSFFVYLYPTGKAT